MMTLGTLLVWWSVWRDAPESVNFMIICGSIAILSGVSIKLPFWLARGLMQIGSLTLFLYIVHTPIISIVSRLDLHSEVVRFSVVLAMSLVAARAFKALYDWVDGKVSDVWTFK